MSVFDHRAQKPYNLLIILNPLKFMMMGHCGCHKKCKAGIVLVFGVLFALGTFNIVPQITFMQYWPLIFVALGLHGLFCGCKGGCKMEK